VLEPSLFEAGCKPITDFVEKKLVAKAAPTADKENQAKNKLKQSTLIDRFKPEKRVLVDKNES